MAPAPGDQGRALLLAGGGHAHLEVLRRVRDAGRCGDARPAITLVSPERYAWYSGMVPGVLAGDYDPDQARVDLDALCSAAGARRVGAAVAGVDIAHRRVLLDDGDTLAFDLLSLDTGSVPDLAQVPGAAARATPVKPVSELIARCQCAPHAAGSEPSARAVVVVGGGAAGVELALAARDRMRTAGRDTTVTIATDVLLATYGVGVRTRVRRALDAAGVRVALGRVERVTDRGVHLGAGAPLPADLLLWATTASAPRWIAQSGLPTDPRGFVAIDRHLRVVGHPRLFAAGDVATRLDRPAPKSGVYAVRAAPILYANLCAALRGEEPRAVFAPQRVALSLLRTGRGRAVGAYGPLAWSGRCVWWLKDRIDRAFVRRFRVP